MKESYCIYPPNTNGIVRATIKSIKSKNPFYFSIENDEIVFNNNGLRYKPPSKIKMYDDFLITYEKDNPNIEVNNSYYQIYKFLIENNTNECYISFNEEELKIKLKYKLNSKIPVNKNLLIYNNNYKNDIPLDKKIILETLNNEIFVYKGKNISFYITDELIKLKDFSLSIESHIKNKQILKDKINQTIEINDIILYDSMYTLLIGKFIDICYHAPYTYLTLKVDNGKILNINYNEVIKNKIIAIKSNESSFDKLNSYLFKCLLKS